MQIVVVGSGIAGLSAALCAAQAGAAVTVVERAAEGEHGGNTRYTEAYLRMKSMDEVADDFVDHFMANAGGYTDPSIVQEMVREHQDWSPLARSQSTVDPDFLGAFADQAGPTLRWLEQAGLRFDFLPTAFITTTTTRLLPVGGGLAMVETLTSACKDAGVQFRFETTARSLATEGGAVIGLATSGGTLSCSAVILACGGFEGNAEMLSRYVGPCAINLRPVARGGHYNKGEGIRMALDIGAAPNGDFGSYHAEPIDPRSGIAEPAIFTFPYGILVNKAGQRFTDEAPGTVDAHYESVTRRIYEQRGGLAWLITDARLDDVPNWQKGSRTDQPPVIGNTLQELAAAIQLPAETLVQTVAAYNAACGEGAFDPLRTDGLATTGLTPPKSNWARPVDAAPFRAWPVISANVFTFGGLKADRHARVIDHDGKVIPGLYAAGETVGIYYRTYTGSTSVLRGAVFGRQAATARHRAGSMTAGVPDGLVALITGGGGMIGQAVANRLGTGGMRLALADLNAPESVGSECSCYAADLADANQLRALVDSVLADFGRIDCLITAAGVTSTGSFESISAEEWDRVHAINLRGVFLANQAVIAPMRRQGFGRIVNIGSVLAKNGGNPRPWIDAGEQDRAGNVAYGAAKAGVHALTLYLAKELAAHGITVNAVAPGPIASSMTSGFPEALVRQIPVGRMGQPNEVAGAVAWLCSPEAAFVTGEIIDINGGLWMD